VTGQRRNEFARNQKLEQLLKELNGLLSRAEESMQGQFTRPRFPVLLVVGAPRSGTTLLTQWLAATGCFAYPSNLLSRFYGAPYIGARIQQLLADPAYNFKDELGDLVSVHGEFSSHIGKTKGVLEPNEFWYFWRRFIPNTDPRWITKDQEAQIDVEGFLAGIAAIEAAFNKPFATKGIILQYNLTCLQQLFENVIFIFTRRHPFYNVQSLLRAREEYFGDRDEWFSVKPKEYDELKEKDAVTQVAGQVHYTNASISRELTALHPRHGLTVQHADFCRNPQGVFDVLRSKLAEFNYPLNDDYRGPACFQLNNQVRVDSQLEQEILATYRDLSGDELEL